MKAIRFVGMRMMVGVMVGGMMAAASGVGAQVGVNVNVGKPVAITSAHEQSLRRQVSRSAPGSRVAQSATPRDSGVAEHGGAFTPRQRSPRATGEHINVVEVAQGIVATVVLDRCHIISDSVSPFSLSYIPNPFLSLL